MDLLAAQLIEDAWGSLAISIYILALFGTTELVGRFTDAPTEWTRKMAHVGSGFCVLAFPWLVSHTVSVLMLALSFSSVLVFGRVTGLLGSIHNVERSTGGVYYYPFAVLLVWVLSSGDPLLYCLPLAIMAVADTGAAIVGTRSGQTQFKVMDGTRSVEGSMAFFSLAFSLCLMGCAIAGRPTWPDLLLVTLVVAALTTAVEAISVRGSDNILIPYAGWMALERTMRLGLDELGDWILGMMLGMGLLFATTARGKVSTAGGVTIFLVATLAWALGGLGWFLPLASLYALYLLGRPARLTTDLDQVFPTTAASIGVLLLFAHTDDPVLYRPFVVTVAASGGIGGWMVGTNFEGTDKWTGTLAGVAVPLVPALLYDPGAGPVVVAGSVLALALFILIDQPAVVGRRVFATSVTGVLTWAYVSFFSSSV